MDCARAEWVAGRVAAQEYTRTSVGRGGARGRGAVVNSRFELFPQRLERDAIKFHWCSPGGEVLSPYLNLTRRAKEDINVVCGLFEGEH